MKALGRERKRKKKKKKKKEKEKRKKTEYGKIYSIFGRTVHPIHTHPHKVVSLNPTNPLQTQR
jgi:hypothetical protein